MIANERALPCIVCGEVLENVAGPNQPVSGLAFGFRTEGHYGTAVFDPMDGSAIEINVCDECLKKAGLAGRVMLYSASPSIDPKLWRPRTPKDA